jgi:uncharacterized protein YdcH (DUF465 family)
MRDRESFQVARGSGDAGPDMEVGNMKQAVLLRGGLQHQLSSIEAHHRRLDERLQQLGRQPFLTPKEQLEVAEIKKHKLRAKDEMTALRRAL